MAGTAVDRPHLELSRELHLDARADGTVVAANPAARALLGEVVGRLVSDVLRTELGAVRGAEEVEVPCLTGPRAMQVRWERTDDRIVVVASDLTDSDGRRVTDGERQQFVDALLDSLREGIVACDAEGTLTLFNRATREFHGLPHEPLPASEWAEHYDLYDTDGVTRMPVERIPLFRALQGEQVTDVELVIAPRDGPRRIVLCNGRALRAPNGTRLGAVVAMHDVTDRVAAEEQLREQTARARAAEVQRQHLERLRELSRLGPGLTATTDLPQLLRRAVLGVRSLVEASGVLLSVSPLGQAAEAATGDPEPGHAVHEVPLPQVDGRLRVSSPDGLDADEQELVSQLGQLVSATAQRIALTEQALQRERRQLRDELLAGVTHDMQTPLAAISGFSQSLLLDLDDDERARAVGALIRQTDVLRQLVLQFLDYVRIRLDRPLRIIEGETRVADAMSKVADLFGSDPRLQVSGLDGHVVAVEQQRLVQVLANLVGNALRHGDGKVSVRIEGGGPGLVTIAVQDEGPGLPDPLREWMTAPTGPPPEGVAGLGIAVTVPLVRALSGTIAAEVDPDGSTTVRVSLPVPGTTGAPAPNAEP